jgi:succinate dehydrogenase/fumarate reductase flavoprotein subunit
MQSLVGIIRTGSELEEALGKLDELEERAQHVAQGWASSTTRAGT